MPRSKPHVPDHCLRPGTARHTNAGRRQRRIRAFYSDLLAVWKDSREHDPTERRLDVKDKVQKMMRVNPGCADIYWAAWAAFDGRTDAQHTADIVHQPHHPHHEGGVTAMTTRQQLQLEKKERAGTITRREAKRLAQARQHLAMAAERKSYKDR